MSINVKHAHYTVGISTSAEREIHLVDAVNQIFVRAGRPAIKKVNWCKDRKESNRVHSALTQIWQHWDDEQRDKFLKSNKGRISNRKIEIVQENMVLDCMLHLIRDRTLSQRGDFSNQALSTSPWFKKQGAKKFEYLRDCNKWLLDGHLQD